MQSIKYTLTFYLIIFIFISQTSIGYSQKNEKKAADKNDCRIKIFGLLPSQAPPSAPVKLYVDDLPAKTKLYIDEKRIHFNRMEDGYVSFYVPKIKAGTYSIRFKHKNGCSSEPAAINITKKRPVISALIPGQIFYCTPSLDRVVLLKGDNFEKNTKVLFDGIVVGSNHISDKELEIKIPHAKSGLHTIIAINPGKISSMTHNFYIEGKPVIYDISVGIKYEDHYELVIEGENFLWGAEPIIEGKKVEGEVTYKSCNLLVHDRELKSEAPQGLSLQVANPDGVKSDIFHLSIP